ncbi:MAG: MFS transporter, partial [Chloroflexota bacterium]
MATQFSEKEGRSWKARFFIIWTGQAISLLGSQLVQFALIWYLTSLTGSAKVLATAALVGLLPQVFLGPFIGSLVDRYNRKTIMVIADSSIAIATVFLAILFASGDIQLWHIYALMFIRSIGGGFHYSAMTASTSLMVPTEQMTRIQGINQTMQGGLNILSAPLGALLLELLDMQYILAIDVATALIAITPLLFVIIPQPARIDAGTAHNTSMWQDTVAGFKY